MKISFKILLASILLFGLIPAAANGQVNLLTPPNGDVLLDPPSFSWNGPYDAWLFISVFHYDIAGVFTGYYPVYFWMLANGFDMPVSWWDPIGEGEPNFWIVLGVDQTTGANDFSSLHSWVKGGECTGECCGAYTLNCNGIPNCICFSTIEGDAVCGPDQACGTPCASSAECGAGQRCITCTCCAESPSVCAVVGEASCGGGFSAQESREGPTISGQWLGR